MASSALQAKLIQTCLLSISGLDQGTKRHLQEKNPPQSKMEHPDVLAPLFPPSSFVRRPEFYTRIRNEVQLAKYGLDSSCDVQRVHATIARFIKFSPIVGRQTSLRDMQNWQRLFTSSDRFPIWPGWYLVDPIIVFRGLKVPFAQQKADYGGDGHEYKIFGYHFSGMIVACFELKSDRIISCHKFINSSCSRPLQTLSNLGGKVNRWPHN